MLIFYQKLNLYNYYKILLLSKGIRRHPFLTRTRNRRDQTLSQPLSHPLPHTRHTHTFTHTPHPRTHSEWRRQSRAFPTPQPQPQPSHRQSPCTQRRCQTRRVASAGKCSPWTACVASCAWEWRAARTTRQKNNWRWRTWAASTPSSKTMRGHWVRRLWRRSSTFQSMAAPPSRALSCSHWHSVRSGVTRRRDSWPTRLCPRCAGSPPTCSRSSSTQKL